MMKNHQLYKNVKLCLRRSSFTQAIDEKVKESDSAFHCDF